MATPALEMGEPPPKSNAGRPTVPPLQIPLQLPATPHPWLATSSMLPPSRPSTKMLDIAPPLQEPEAVPGPLAWVVPDSLAVPAVQNTAATAPSTSTSPKASGPLAVPGFPTVMARPPAPAVPTGATVPNVATEPRYGVRRQTGTADSWRSQLVRCVFGRTSSLLS